MTSGFAVLFYDRPHSFTKFSAKFCSSQGMCAWLDFDTTVVHAFVDTFCWCYRHPYSHFCRTGTRKVYGMWTVNYSKRASLRDKYFVGLLLCLQGDQKPNHADELSYSFNSALEEDKHCAYTLHFKDKIESYNCPDAVGCSECQFRVATYIRQ